MINEENKIKDNLINIYFFFISNYKYFVSNEIFSNKNDNITKQIFNIK